jgi:misacylated tRNA(Ala) deacylase
MSTEELAPVDSYLRSVKARVIDHHPDGVVLDRTAFYARGGGQPGDIGVLHADSGGFVVSDTYRKDGAFVHRIEGDRPTVGTLVEASINWDRRYLLMKTHTALHALTGIVFDGFRAKVTGGNMQPGSARMDFELESISQEFGRMVEQQLNAALLNGHPVEVREIDRELALEDPMLIRTKVNMIPEYVDRIRVVDIVGLDRQADGGTHVNNTAEVGLIKVVKTESKGKANKRIRIEIV